jgi:microcystin-dependent protein
MGWKWHRFLRAATSGAPAASALGEGAPYYDTTTKRLRISDGTAWSDDTLQPGTGAAFFMDTAPDGWLSCDGAAVSRTTYARLFAKLSTTWGVGNGTTTFNLPDMRGASAAGIGTSTGYTQNETLAIGTKYNDQLQGHYHYIRYQTPGNLQNGDVAVTPGSGAFAVKTQTPVGGENRLVAEATFTDGTNGTPREGNVTRGKVVGVLWCIKY